jgi:endonuclease YncB( thermonuclease family)
VAGPITRTMGVRVLLAGVVAALVLAAPASASTGKCVAGAGWSPTCTFWTGKVTLVADGDTIDVDINGDGTHKARRVRITGINAMELSVYSHTASRRRGDCHGVEATARLEQLIRRSRWRVRLAAQDRRSHSGVRLRRQISVRRHGKWVDAGRIMLAEGHALWLGNPIEWAWNRAYAQATDQAAAKHLRLFDPQGCGAGPAASLTMQLNWDAPHNDHDNVNGEWARVRNTGASAVSLHRWWFRDSDLRRFTFPAGTVIPGGGAITLHMGRGTNTRDTFYWGLSTPPLDNISYDDKARGDGGYLFDPRGNLRAYVIYH